MEARTFRGPAFRGVECYIFHLAGGIIAIFVSRINELDDVAVDAAALRIAIAERRFNLRFIERHGLDVADNDEPFLVQNDDGTSAVGLTAIYEPRDPARILQPVADCSRAIKAASIATLLPLLAGET